MKNKKILLCLSLVLSGGLAKDLAAQETSETQTSQALSYDERCVGSIDIRIENLPEGTSFDKQTVLAKLRTRQGGPFSQFTFDQDLKQLAGDYDRIDPQIQLDGDEVKIVLKVWLRPVIRNIDWVGNEFVKTRTLRKELDIKPGSIFNRVEFNRAFNKVKEYYIKKGYFESQLGYKLITDPKTKEVDVIIEIDEGRAGRVENIVFKGLNSDEESDILNKLYTKKYSKLTSWFTGSGKFLEEALEQDRLTIFNYLQNKGYADADVDIKILESPTTGKIIIDISADKGERYRFGQVSFDGNILLDDDDVERAFSARPNATYSPEKLRKTAEAIKDLYGRKGYIDTSVTYETQLLQDSPVYNVHFSVDEGREYRIGMIRIIGNSQTEDRVILRESLLVPGETFDSRKLKVTQARLENIGYFKTVNVYAVRTQEDLSLGDNYRDIYIEVDETQTGNISLFGGYNRGSRIFGGLDFSERNFNYKGIASLGSEGLSALRGGGEYLHLRSSFGSEQQTATASWLTPYFLDTPWRLGLEFVANINNLTSKDVGINTYNFSTFLSYPLSPYLSYGFKYRVRNFEVDYSSKIEDLQSNQSDLGPTTGILSGLGATLTYDTTDSALKPHRGFRSGNEIEYVGLGGSANFLRTITINSYYTPLWSRGYMRYRADFRFIYPVTKGHDIMDIPSSERFFLGGVNSVRGYKDFILGPRFDKPVNSDDPSQGVKKAESIPVGGLSSSLLSLEYIQEILPIADLFLFIDAGYVTDQPFAVGTYRMSYGVGMNVDLLGKMPITFGWGFPVNALDGQTQNFFFSLGGAF